MCMERQSIPFAGREDGLARCVACSPRMARRSTAGCVEPLTHSLAQRVDRTCHMCISPTYSDSHAKLLGVVGPKLRSPKYSNARGVTVVSHLHPFFQSKTPCRFLTTPCSTFRQWPTPVQNPDARERSAQPRDGTTGLVDSAHATATAPIDAHRMATSVRRLGQLTDHVGGEKAFCGGAALVPLLCARRPAEHDATRRNAPKAAAQHAIVMALHRDRSCYLSLSSHPLSCCASSYCEERER